MIIKFDEVNLNLRHYSGDRSDVIKEVKNRISNYLKQENITSSNRAIYSAIYHALTYYQTLSDVSITAESVQHTFLENTLHDFYEDYMYLSSKYNSPDPTVPKVINVKGRIKSPISAMDKILEKVTEYVHEGRDLTRLNESLRDFIGLRFIIDPPPEVKALGKQAESDFCYEVFNELMTRKGILRQVSNEEPEETDSRFISVNTDHKPNKIKKIMTRPKREGYAFVPEEEGVFIPESRPNCVEPYSEFFKDYRRWPKQKLYQRIHICAEPHYSKYVLKEKTPTFITPRKNTRPAIEYQFCLLAEDEFAEYGKAAHTGYKDRSFHRAAIPLIIGTNSSFETIGPTTIRSNNTEPDKIRLGRFDESMEVFFGYSFEEMFNIDYQTFLNTFNTQERDEILARRKKIQFDKETEEYRLVPAEKYIPVESPKFLKNLLANTTDDELLKFLEANDLLDETLSPQENIAQSRRLTIPNFKVIPCLNKSSRATAPKFGKQSPRRQARDSRAYETFKLRKNLGERDITEN